MNRGEIIDCASAACGHRCCDFSQGNFIALYPGELNRAVATGKSLAHLEVRPSSDGGHRAICRACDTSSCDGGYKPLDCASYPFFPVARTDGSITVSLFGKKCPLLLTRLARHRAWVAREWSSLVKSSKNVLGWLKATQLIGYRDLQGVSSSMELPTIDASTQTAADSPTSVS